MAITWFGWQWFCPRPGPPDRTCGSTTASSMRQGESKWGGRHCPTAPPTRSRSGNRWRRATGSRPLGSGRSTRPLGEGSNGVKHLHLTIRTGAGGDRAAAVSIAGTDPSSNLLRAGSAQPPTQPLDMGLQPSSQPVTDHVQLLGCQAQTGRHAGRLPMLQLVQLKGLQVPGVHLA